MRALAPLSLEPQNRLLLASAAPHSRIAPGASSAPAVAGLFIFECERDGPRVALPRPEVQLVVRFGATRSGLDAHALGVRHHVHRKLLRGGQRALTARLRLGAQQAVLGVPASEIAGRIVSLEDLWGDAATRRLYERLAAAQSTMVAASILESAIAERLGPAKPAGWQLGARLALAAADKLTCANVNSVASELGVSERHLRRVFRDTVGMSPKAFTKLARFHRALRAARADARLSWASIAAGAGYYDQAHLIAEFRAIAGVTPRALLGELGGVASGAMPLTADCLR